MTSLESIVLSRNSLNGTVPDLKPLTSLTELDLAGNRFGPEFPLLSKNLVSLVLKNNSFGTVVPMGLASLDKMQKLDFSMNRFTGNIPPFLFSLPSVQYLDLSKNKFTGALPTKLACGDKLGFVDISSNLLVGELPSCIVSNSSTRVVFSSANCLILKGSGYQHPKSYCSRDPLAAILPPARREEEEPKNKLGLILGIVGGIIGGAMLVGLLVFLVFKKARPENVESVKLPKLVPIKAMKTTCQVSPRTPADASKCT